MKKMPKGAEIFIVCLYFHIFWHITNPKSKLYTTIGCMVVPFFTPVQMPYIFNLKVQNVFTERAEDLNL